MWRNIDGVADPFFCPKVGGTEVEIEAIVGEPPVEDPPEEVEVGGQRATRQGQRVTVPAATQLHATGDLREGAYGSPTEFTNELQVDRHTFSADLLLHGLAPFVLKRKLLVTARLGCRASNR